MCDVAERLEKKGRMEGRMEGRIEGRIEGRTEMLGLLKWLRSQGRSDEIEKVLEGDSDLAMKLLDEMTHITNFRG